MVKLYVCDITNLISELSADMRSIEQYFSKLGKARIEHILNYKKAEDRARTLGASYLLLFALKKEGYFIDKLPDFYYLENGKPYLEGYPNLHFNLSHSNNMILCAISDIEVGVDIEKYREMKVSTLFKIFTEKERAGINGKEEEYISLWTAKEAAAKVEGKGIALIKDGLEVISSLTEKYVKILNPNIIKTFCYYIIAEGKAFDSFDNSYYFSVCAMEKTTIQIHHHKWYECDIR